MQMVTKIKFVLWSHFKNNAVAQLILLFFSTRTGTFFLPLHIYTFLYQCAILVATEIDRVTALIKNLQLFTF
jgi:hypothetical protein